MIISYLTITLRNFLKRKTFSLIKILGLSVGMVACFLILHWAQFEKSYDSFHQNLDHIYRLRGGARADSSAASGAAVKEAFPEVLDIVKFVRAGSRGVYSYGDIHIRQENCYTTTNSLLDVFSFKILLGDHRTALTEPNAIIITKSIATAYFGEEDPTGKFLTYNGQVDYKITAVMEDVPSNSSIPFDILLSWPTVTQRYGERINTDWILWGIHHYLLLKPETDIEALQAKLDIFVKEKQGEINRPESFWEMYHLQPFKNIHLDSAFVYEMKENGSGQAVNLLMLIALLIMVIAWGNYINLSTARSVERSKEVGVRKVVGANRRQLLRQFLLEALIINLAALILALVATEIALPVFNRFAGTPDSLLVWQDIRFWGVLSAVLLAGSFLSGLYPALILSSFDPVATIKQGRTPTTRGHRLRKSLVVFQFMLSAVLIAGSLTVYRQIHYMANADLGVDIDSTLVLNRPTALLDKTREEYESRIEAFKAELSRIQGIEKISRSSYVPGEDVGAINEGQKADLSIDETIDVYEIQVDDTYFDLYKLKFLAGRKFSKEYPTDSQAVILNETARRLLQYASPESAINTKFIYITEHTLEVIGVVDDWHQESLKQSFEPMVFIYRPANNGYYSLKLQSQEPKKLLADVNKLWEKFYPGNPFDYFFLNERYGRLYSLDRQFLKMFSLFSLLAMFVACLGLLGLSLFNADQRFKEIGIRKALGASLPGILGLLFKDFAKLILLANLAALPLFYLYSNNWLNRYPFRTEISWWFFLVPVVTTFLIAALVVLYHSMKAAKADPVKALRYE